MHRTIEALRLHPDLTAEVAEIPAAPLAAGDVRVRTAAAGICGSDVHAAQTGAWIEYWPATTGHEVAGVVTESAAADVPTGLRVVVDSRLPCRSCDDCARSPRLCARLTWLGESRPGGFADELVVPATLVHPVRDDALPLDVAVLAEPLAVVLTALRGIPEGTASVLVQGYGPIGALAHLELRSRGIDVTVAEPDAGRREVAASRGARRAPDAADRPFDVVIDAAGYPGSVAAGFAAVRRGGTVLVIAIGDHPIDISAQDLVEKGVSIVTSVGFDDDGIPAALDALAADPVLFGGVVSDRIRLADLPPRLMAPPPALGKVVVTFA